MVTVWSKGARAELHKAYLYVLLDSLQNAEMVRDDLIDATISLSKYPEKHPLDKFKKDNDGTWRAFEKHHYRISYRIMPNEIRMFACAIQANLPLTFNLQRFRCIASTTLFPDQR